MIARVSRSGAARLMLALRGERECNKAENIAFVCVCMCVIRREGGKRARFIGTVIDRARFANETRRLYIRRSKKSYATNCTRKRTERERRRI